MHTYGEALVRKWAPKFGLGDFRIQVVTMRPDNKEAWALSFYDVEELWGIIDLPPDESMPAELLELIVLHELAHGLLLLAEAGDVAAEQACNRIARLTRGDFETRLANEDAAHRLGEAWFNDEHPKKSAYPSPGPRPGHGNAKVGRREWLPIVIDALPYQERTVINMLYIEGMSLREAAQQVGVSHTTIQDRRDSALLRLNRYFDKLEKAPWLAE